jgi:hypothetical protein
VVPNKLSRPESIVKLAERLAGFGYYVVPIPRGSKGPTIPGWDKLRLKPEDCANYFADGNLVGILHVNNLVLDIDCYDPALSARICAEARRRFPGALERVGQAPKSAFFLRMDEPGFKVHNTAAHERIDEDGCIITASVEIRSMTRQAVVYGIHPDTGQPYRWVNGPELWETPLADLPLAKQDEVQSFRDWADDQVKKWAGVADPKVIDLGLFHRTAFGDDRATEEQFLEALRHVPASLGHESGWRETLMAIHDFYGGSARGLDVAKDWSAADPRFNPREVETKWRSFEPGKGVTYKSVFHHAKQNGANLSAIAAMGRPAFKPDTFRIDTGDGDDAQGASDAPKGKPGALEWFDDINPVLTDTYTVKGVLGAGAMSVVYGPSNSGKTFFALDMAFHVAAGLDWRGLRVKQTCVLYLAAEGGSGVANRVSALRRETGAHGIPFALRRAGLDLLHAQADLKTVYDLAQEVMAKKPGLPLLIVIDTLSRVMAGGDENSPVDMTALIRNIDAIREATGAHIMLVHHTGKDAAKGARGHSSLRAATDTEIEVMNEDGARAAQVTKQRDYAGGEVWAFNLRQVPLGIDQDGDEVSSCVVEPADAEEFKRSKKKLTKNQKLLAETFDQLIGDGLGRPNPGGAMMPPPGAFLTLQMDDFRAACEGKMATKNTRDAFLTAFDALNRPDGIFCMASGFVWRTDRRIK